MSITLMASGTGDVTRMVGGGVCGGVPVLVDLLPNVNRWPLPADEDGFFGCRYANECDMTHLGPDAFT